MDNLQRATLITRGLTARGFDACVVLYKPSGNCEVRVFCPEYLIPIQGARWDDKDGCWKMVFDQPAEERGMQ